MKRSFAWNLALAVSLTAGLYATLAEAGEADDPPCHHEELAAVAPLDAESVYQVDSSWTRSDDAEFRLSELRGKVRVAAIFFANCEYACPILVAKMKKLQASLTKEQRDRVGFVLVSMDVERDDPPHLRAYAERMKLEGDWTLLHGNDADVRELAAVLGIRYRKEKDGSFSHSNMITVLDREGRVAHRSIGLEGDPSEALAAVTGLLE
jgi:protein SCO1/2